MRMMVWQYPDKIGLYERDGDTFTKIDERPAVLEQTGGIFQSVKVPPEWGVVQHAVMGIPDTGTRLTAKRTNQIQ